MQTAAPFVRLLRVVSAVCAAVLLASAAGRAVVHLRDLHGIGHVAGIWMALAQYGGAGVLYPPLEADGLYAGTRYMPLCFGLIAALVRFVGDYVVAAKLMALGSMAALLAGVFVAVRRITGRALDAVVLTGLVLATPEGVAALLSPHADALAAALSVAGLLIIQCRSQNAECRMKDRDLHSAFCILTSALFFVAALLTKFSAVAAPVAAAGFLLRRGRRRALLLIVSYVVMAAGALTLLECASDGRFLDNFHNLGSGGMSLDSVRIGPARVVFALGREPAAAAVLALAVFSILFRGPERGLGLWDGYFVAAALVTVAIFTSPGTGFNHLLELEVAAVLASARLLAPRADGGPARRGAAVRLTVLAVLLAGGFALFRDGGEDDGDVPGRVVVAALPEGASVLAEDATVPVLLGRRPVVLDAFAFRVLSERGRVDDRALADRVSRAEFDVLVLMGRVDRPGESLCPSFHFGPRVTEAMRRAYRFDRRVGPYYLFVPAGERGRVRAPSKPGGRRSPFSG